MQCTREQILIFFLVFCFLLVVNMNQSSAMTVRMVLFLSAVVDGVEGSFLCYTVLWQIYRWGFYIYTSLKPSFINFANRLDHDIFFYKITFNLRKLYLYFFFSLHLQTSVHTISSRNWFFSEDLWRLVYCVP